MNVLRLFSITIVLLLFPPLLAAQNTIWGWGENIGGQLGDGSGVNQMTPLQIGTDADWVAVTCGYHHTLALKASYNFV